MRIKFALISFLKHRIRHTWKVIFFMCFPYIIFPFIEVSPLQIVHCGLVRLTTIREIHHGNFQWKKQQYFFFNVQG